MQHYQQIEHKLSQFIKKYYYNQLLKGSIISLGSILALSILIAAVEYFLWLNPTGRLILLIVGCFIMLAILSLFVIKPILKLTKISKGIDFYSASNLIGQHFKEVNDKLTNILQLKEQGASNEFIIASIEQKSKEIRSIPFQMAVNFSYNLKYLRFAVIPLLIIVAIWVSGQGQFFSDSYFRMANYEKEFEPPAPFRFQVLNDSLTAIAGRDFTIKVKTSGQIAPEQINIHLNDEKFSLEQLADGSHIFNLQNLTKTTEFFLSANGLKSKTYKISLLKTPELKGLALQLKFPSYINRPPSNINGTGNATIPEGTEILWQISTAHTTQVNLLSNTKTIAFNAENNLFKYQQKIRQNLDYQISISNALFSNYETLNYQIKVVKDEYPQLKLQSKQDTINQKQRYFFAKLSDDYGLTKAEIEITNTKTDSSFTKPISIAKNSFATFNYAVPNPELKFKPGNTYRYVFKVYDNDAVNGRKSSQSEVFYFNKPSQVEAKKENLKQQQEAINQINQSLSKNKAAKKELSDLKQISKEKQQLNYTDKQKLRRFVERQEQQMVLMKSYAKKLEKQLEDLDSENQDKKELQNRLEQNQEKIDQNKKLLDELKKLQEKIDQENLDNALEEFDKEQKKQEQSLEQLLELTKHFYLEEKQKQLADELKSLAEKQENLAKSKENSSEKQKDLSQEFKQLQDEIKQLKEENENLEKPMDIGSDKFLEENIKSDQKTAEEELSESEKNSNKQQSKQKAQKAQQNAAKQMRQLSKKMQQQMMAGGMQQQQEDAEMLKQILDNLIVYSIEQEKLMNDFSKLTNKNPLFPSKLRRQAELRENFKHVDDSLFELAKRNMMITSLVNNAIEDIKFNTIKTLENLSENKIGRGISYQQYIMKDANQLANLLSQSLDQMQQQMNGSGQGQGGKPKPGQGQGSGQQLSDIIKSHDELSKAMKKGQQKGQKPGNKSDGEEGQEANEGGDKNGNKGKNGNSGGDNQGGKNGKGQSNSNASEKGQSNNEPNAGESADEIYRIFKQQQKLRQQLEDRIKELGLNANSKALEKSLNELEQELLMKGFTNKLLQKMESVKHQLLKLEEAANKQGKDQQRQAETNTKTFNNNQQKWIEKSKEYFNSTELLNRQQLPLQPKFKLLIEQYFKITND
ncbi:DUF4175 family protein [Psychroflexus sp. ALD_RP9]|uniref:DUF4175 family protein n=1 Tax=Psychroflexus sp. ALD_RP9 TaxID=2777186 RepID=UPI001A8D56B7|nr:DUF4175 family protein [Psychroflexus sp. ALD_RP9]QSS98130.1 DUF4175 family protein [Psychroflexus sp. ALD_RP9]